MSDIFREVDDEVRQQKLEVLWKKYGNLLIACIVLLVMAVGAWRFYQHKQEQFAEKTSEKYESALEFIKAGKSQEAEAAFSSVMSEGTPNYKTLAQLRNTAEISKRDAASAVKLYDALASDPTIGAILQDLAKLRAASLLSDSISESDLTARIGAIAVDGNPWRNSARELLGLAKFKSGDLSAASSYFEQIALDTETPSTMRERAQLLLAQVRGGQVIIK
jgi:hypothetical protein